VTALFVFRVVELLNDGSFVSEVELVYPEIVKATVSPSVGLPMISMTFAIIFPVTGGFVGTSLLGIIGELAVTTIDTGSPLKNSTVLEQFTELFATAIAVMLIEPVVDRGP
jgi:hypothetical protein